MSNKAAPTQIGPYQLVALIHSSPVGQLWQAYHPGQQRSCALKTLLDHFHKDKEKVGYLKWEYEVGAKLEHPRVIRTYEFSNDRGIPYLTTEWFQAPNLKQRIQQGTENLAPIASKIILQSTEALAYFNGLGWVHRDIKPENFLVANDGEVKLIDFALAQRRKTGIARLFATRSKVQGTRSYISPEQIRGSAFDERSDLYSLACTFFELLAGRPPLVGTSTNDLLSKHLKATPPRLESLNKNVTPEFAELIRRALAKEPAERPSMQDFLRQVQYIRIFRRIPPTPAPVPPAAK